MVCVVTYDQGLEEQLLTVRDVSELLNISTSSIYHWRLTGDGPPAIKIGSRLRFDPQQLRAWIASRSEPA